MIRTSSYKYPSTTLFAVITLSSNTVSFLETLGNKSDNFTCTTHSVQTFDIVYDLNTVVYIRRSRDGVRALLYLCCSLKSEYSVQHAATYAVYEEI